MLGLGRNPVFGPARNRGCCASALAAPSAKASRAIHRTTGLRDDLIFLFMLITFHGLAQALSASRPSVNGSALLQTAAHEARSPLSAGRALAAGRRASSPLMLLQFHSADVAAQPATGSPAIYTCEIRRQNGSEVLRIFVSSADRRRSSIGSGDRRSLGARPWPISRDSATRPNTAWRHETAEPLARHCSSLHRTFRRAPPEPPHSTLNPQTTTNMLSLIPKMGKRTAGCAKRPLFPAESGNKLISDPDQRYYGEAPVLLPCCFGGMSGRAGSLFDPLRRS